MAWCYILLIVIASLILWFALSSLFYRQFFKRFYDVALSGLALIVLSPILLITAILVRVKLGSPVLFKQDRPGRGEKIFKLYKFRTMTDARDEHGELLSDTERLTAFGRRLRSTSLDELPELFNIIKGDMSIVGPRPLLVSYLPYYRGKERIRHNVRPGLSGLAQISGRNNIGWDARLSKDVEYVERFSFGEDVKIVFKTILQVLRHEDVAVDATEEGNLAIIRSEEKK